MSELSPADLARGRELLSGMTADSPGTWEVDGDRFVVEPDGSWLKARGEVSGAAVDPRWVLSRGRKVA